MLALVELSFVAQLARIGGIGQQHVQVGLYKGLTAHLAPFASHPSFVSPAPALQLSDHRQQGLVLQIKIKDGSYSSGFPGVDHQPKNPTSPRSEILLTTCLCAWWPRSCPESARR